METVQTKKALQLFLKEIDTFPSSSERSTFYSIEKLLSLKENDIFKEFLGEEQLKKAFKLIFQAQEAIKLCKNGELEEGYRLFEVVQEKRVQLSENASHYVYLYYLSGIAYYHYRKGDFNKALECTWEEILQTQFLEAKGATTLHYRRAGHILNAVKLLSSSNRVEEALQYSLGNVLYAINGDTSMMPKGEWNHQLLDFVPYIRQRFLDICFLNTVEILIENQELENKLDISFYSKYLSQIPDFEVTNNNLAIMYNFLYLQKLYSQKKNHQFIIDAIEFLQVNFDYTFDVLKLSICSKMISLIKSTDDLDRVQKKEALTKINDYISENLNSKPPLKQSVCNLIIE